MSHKFDRFQTQGGASAGLEDVFFKVCASIRSPLAMAVALGGLSAMFVATPALVAEPSDGVEVPTEVGEPLDSYSTDAGESFKVSLNEAILRALQHNVSLAVERYQRSSTLLGITEARGIYDLELTADLTASNESSPPTSLLEEAQIVTSDSEVWNFGLQQASPFGGGGSVTFANRRTESSNENVQPNPQYVVDLDIGYQQPLLRNFGRTVTERNIIVAKTNSKINREQFRQQVETVVRSVSDVYWDLVEAKAQLAVSEESLALAKDLHRMNKIQVEVGTLAPLEMVQSEVGVATREEEIIRRRQSVGDSEDSIRRLINLEQGDLWDVPLDPSTDPEIAHEPIDLKTAVETAFEKRSDVLQKALTNSTSELDAEVAHNQVKPRLDLTAQYRLNAVAGKTFTGETSYSDALDSITGLDFDGWSVVLNFAMPLQNRAAKARAAQADLLVEQNQLELRDLKDQVMVEVRRAARAVETAAKAIESAKVSSKLAQKNLEAEQKRYENGLSTSFQVLEIQEDLSAARSREVTAVIGYRKALTSFYLLTGQLLEVNRVTLAAED